MSQSRIPSPARSQGAPITPRRYKSRTRSVGSPARSTTSVRLSALAQFKENNKDSFVLSPAPSRRSVLNDDTDIEEPRRRSWWRKLNDNSRDVMEVLNDNKVLETNEAVEEYIDIEVLSQEKKNYTLDLPDSSDSESISSIVIPQRKLFTQKDQAQNKFGQLIGTRETLAKLHKSTAADKTVNVPPKNLFGQGTRPKSKPVFPAALLNLSSNKTVNKTKENVAAEVKGQVRSLFGNRAGTKRKNMFADFIVSESEDEISEIQPKVFGFPKKPDTRRDSATSRGKREHSPTSSITTDIEMEEWKMLPSSTMVENQLEDMMAAAKTPVKRPRLSKLPDIKETETKSTVEQIEKEPSDEEQELKYDDEDDKSEVIHEQQMQDQREVDDNEHDGIQTNITIQSTTNKITEGKEKTMGMNEEDKQNKSHATSRNVSKVKDKNVNQSKIPSVNQQNNVSQHKMSPEKEQDVEMEVELTQKKDNNTVVKNKSYRDSNSLQKDKADQSKAQNNDDVANVDQVDNCDEGNDQNKSKNNHNVSLKQNRDISQVKSNTSQEKGNDKEAIAANASDNLDQDEQEELNENVDEEIQEENEDQIQNDIEEQASESKEPENDSEEQNEDVELQNQSEIIKQDEDHEVSMAQESETEQNKDEMDVQNDSLVQNHEDCENNAHNESAAEDQNQSVPEVQSEQEEEVQDSEQEDEENQEDNEVENESSAEDQDNEVENQSEIEEDDDRNASDAEMEQVSAVQDENDMEDEDGINESAEVQNEEDAEENESDNEQNDDEEEVNESAEVNDSEEDQNESAEVNEMEDQNESAEVNDTEEEQNESAEVNDTEEDQNESAEVQNDDEEEDAQNESAEMDNDIDNDAQNESEHQENEDSNDQQQSDYEAPNDSHDTTGRHRKKKDTNVNSPEAILHDKTNQLESFTAQGRNTSVRKTTMLKNMTIRPSLAPPRESTGISDGTTNSSAEGSGWDSHRTTRKTLRQTFGRDFTPRKSLRALVMEKSAKRQTAISEVTAKFPQANSTELQLPEASMVPDDCEMTVEEDRQESNHDVSKRTRQTTLEMYLQKIKMQNMERNLKMQEAVRNSLKAPTTDVLNPFKVPARPMFSSRKPNKAASKPKAKPVKSALIPLDDLPPELLEDMKYKPPKRFQPSNASWITKRLYKFLESKLESKYDYKARVRAEKLVQTIYHFAKDLRRVPVAPAPAVDALKLEMARLGVVTTHFDFYQFFHEYMPREVRIKVVPDIVNKISVPRHGVFSDIIRGNTVQG
ncbi:FK506-binding protein 5-like [Ostrinia nubilalis]|uniref:FK506-binding protein 5-like n=1 Tax=Ostrinia nubilalis TaxID=29057 RepID=UPI0030823EF2